MGVYFSIDKDNSPKIREEFEKACRRALKAVGIEAERAVKEITHVGTPESTHKPGYRGGTLKKSITHEVNGNESVTIGTDVEYAVYVEMGTIKMKAQPYLRPGIYDNMDRWKDIIIDQLKS